MIRNLRILDPLSGIHFFESTLQSGAAVLASGTPVPGVTTTGTRGEGFLDIHLNATTRWKDVPEHVWTYTLGGYQVLKKWLSYRESALLGRPLTSDEAQQFTHHVRRITSILAENAYLDEHYRKSI